MKSDKNSGSTCSYKGTLSFVLSLEARECFQQPLIILFTKNPTRRWGFFVLEHSNRVLYYHQGGDVNGNQ
jgi:hypothetical protein